MTHFVKTGNEDKTQHRIMVRQHTLNRQALAVICTCGDLFEEPAYEGDENTPEDVYAVPLSVLMDIAERHFADVDRF